MPRYFMPANLKKRDHLLYLMLQDDGDLFAFYRDHGSNGVSQAFRLGWIEQRVAEGTWVEMPLPPVFSNTGETALVVSRSESTPTDRNFIPLYAARVLYGLGHHALAQSLYNTTDAAALKKYLQDSTGQRKQ